MGVKSSNLENVLQGKLEQRHMSAGEGSGGNKAMWGGMMPYLAAGENMMRESWTLGKWLHKG